MTLCDIAWRCLQFTQKVCRLHPYSILQNPEDGVRIFLRNTVIDIRGAYVLSPEDQPSVLSPLWEPEKSWTCDLGFKTYNYKCRFTIGLQMACSSGCAVKSVGLRPLSCKNCRLDLHRVHWCLSFVNVVCCSVEVNATGRSFVQEIATEYMFVCVCVSLSVVRYNNNPLHFKMIG